MVWKLITLKQYPMFSRWWMHHAFSDDMKDTLGMNFTKYKSLYNGTYADSQELKQLKDMLISKLKKDTNLILELCKKWRNECDDLLYYTRKIQNTDFSKYSNEDILRTLEGAIKKFRRSASYIYLSHALDNYFENWLNKILDKRLEDKLKRRLYFQILSATTKTTKLLEAKKKLAKIAEIVKSKEIQKAERMINEYMMEFRWLGYDTGIGADLTLEDVKDKISSILKQIEQKRKMKNRSEVVEELNLTSKEKQILDLMSEIIYLRTYRVESHMIAGSNIRQLIEELAKRANTTYENLVQLTLDEIVQLLNLHNEIQRRKYKYGLLMLNGKNKIFSGDDVGEIEEEIIAPIGISEINGMVANPGTAKGPAKIILNKKDFGKMQFGDILVTKMTNPDFIVVLERCSAIVADIGGITSHASIIARELNKPCVIGTKFATKVLKDGDFVEVDANKGIVRKV